jgi:hypothetical protein
LAVIYDHIGATGGKLPDDSPANAPAPAGYEDDIFFAHVFTSAQCIEAFFPDKSRKTSLRTGFT